MWSEFLFLSLYFFLRLCGNFLLFTFLKFLEKEKKTKSFKKLTLKKCQTKDLVLLSCLYFSSREKRKFEKFSPNQFPVEDRFFLTKFF